MINGCKLQYRNYIIGKNVRTFKLYVDLAGVSNEEGPGGNWGEKFRLLRNERCS